MSGACPTGPPGAPGSPGPPVGLGGGRWGRTRSRKFLAALTLNEEGRLPLMSPLSAYYPQFASVQVGLADANGQVRTERRRFDERLRDVEAVKDPPRWHLELQRQRRVGRQIGDEGRVYAPRFAKDQP